MMRVYYTEPMAPFFFFEIYYDCGTMNFIWVQIRIKLG